MKSPEDIHAHICGLFAGQNLAVVATHRQQQPYASLVAFVATDDLKHIDFVTPKTTRKFANLSADKRVAVLINNSTNQSSDFHRAISVTAVGKAREVTGHQRGQLVDPYLDKHPYLAEFATSPTCAFIRVTVQSYYLVRNFQHVMELHLFE